MSFSFNWRKKEITYNDCQLLESEFTQAAQGIFPGAKVLFFPAIPKKIPEKRQKSLELVIKENAPFADDKTNEIFLPLPAGNGKPLILAVLQEVEPISAAELSDRHIRLGNELTRLKQWAIEPITGLLSGHCFLARINDVINLSKETDEKPLPATMALVEMFPRVKDAEQAALYLSKAGAYLDSLIGHIAMTCHFGAGVFGLFWGNASHNNSLKIADMLLRWLKREDISKVHIGLSFRGNGENFAVDLENMQEQAWEALQTARKRGPYSLCSAASLVKPEDHPLRRLPRANTLALRRLWRKKEKFSLFIMRLDQPVTDDHFPARVITLAGPEAKLLPIDQREACIFIPDIEAEKARIWADDFKKRLKAADLTCSLGLADYPFNDYKKSEIPDNSRKALHHSGFYGPDSLTIFDSVSLNISGDVYYNEGNLAKAVREYRKGLAIDPQNINLLNSLGVALAQMNQYRRAIPLFEQVLTVKPDDFMALFNLGFALLARKKTNAALARFEEALQIDDHNFGLLLQLGKLYCRSARYEEAVNVLRKGCGSDNRDKRDMGHGAIYHYLGEACAGLGRNREAIEYLQRAVSHNSRDAGSLSLLGALYNIEKEGDEISLSLCQQAVRLDGSRWLYWLRLGQVQLSQGDARQACKSFEHGLRVNRRQGEIWYFLGQAYEKLADKRAEKMYTKAVKLDNDNQEAIKALARLQPVENTVENSKTRNKKRG
jgi:tetratricopeptide (TPR) repeat protein